MLSLRMLHANDNLETPAKHAKVYITHETYPDGEKINSAFIFLSQHKSIGV